MRVTLSQTEKLLRGSQAFSQLGFSMMLTRMKTRYANDPSPNTLQACNTEINTFLNKFKAVMSADFTLITKL